MFILVQLLSHGENNRNPKLQRNQLLDCGQLVRSIDMGEVDCRLQNSAMLSERQCC